MAILMVPFWAQTAAGSKSETTKKTDKKMRLRTVRVSPLF
jgi:hypothetical protein